MSLLYVTGTPGVGKTTIQKELIKRGYRAFDIDQKRFGGPVNLKTGKRSTVPPIENRDPDWFKQHEWRVSRASIEKLKSEAEGETVYLCGVTTTEDLVWDLFDKIFYLDIDEQTLRTRILNRHSNDFGKGKGELEIILQRHKNSREKMTASNVVIINATDTLSKVVGSIILASQ